MRQGGRQNDRGVALHAHGRIAWTLGGAIAALSLLLFVTALMWCATEALEIVARGRENAHDTAAADAMLALSKSHAAMSFDVVQVQQFLTDVSATRAEDHLDSGFREADAFARRFRQDAAETRRLAAILGAPGIVKGVSQVEAEFEPYYAQGRIMAHTYIDQGTAAGNARISGFDRQADALTSSIGTLGVALDKLRQSMADADSREKSADLLSKHIHLYVAIGLALIGMLLAVAMMRLLQKRVLGPIRVTSAYMTRLATGDYEQPPHYLDRRDELGSMARSIERFREAVIERRKARLTHEKEILAYQDKLEQSASDVNRLNEVRSAILTDLGDALECVAVGDLGVRLEAKFPEGFDQLRIDFNASMESLGKVMQSILEATEAVSFGASELSRAAERLSSRTDQQAASVRESAQSLDYLHGEVNASNEKASEALTVASEAKRSAERTTQVMGRTISAMGRIEASSSQIGRISSVIDEIAFQTNLLALNAGVEAARAGEAGRGFAVVAQEVRALAQRSASAAREINELVATARREISQGGEEVGETSQAIDEIVRRVVDIHGLVQGISVSNQAQAENIRCISDAVSVIDEITQNNASMVAEATSASQLLADEASGLTSSISRFKSAIAAKALEPGQEAEAGQQSALEEIDRLFG